MVTFEANTMVKPKCSITSPNSFVKLSLSPIKSSHSQSTNDLSLPPTIPTLDDILKDSYSTSSTVINKLTFADFLSRIHCLENLEFILEIQQYFKFKSVNLKKAEKIWENIYTNFLIDNSINEVNLPSKIKKSLINSNRSYFEFYDESIEDNFLDLINPSEYKLPCEKTLHQAYKIIKELLHDSYLEYIKNMKNQSNFENNENYCLSSSAQQRRRSECIPPHVNINSIGNQLYSDRCISPLSPPFPATHNSNSNSNQSSCFSSPIQNFNSFIDTPLPIPRTNHLIATNTSDDPTILKSNVLISETEEFEHLNLTVTNSNDSHINSTSSTEGATDNLILTILKSSTYDGTTHQHGKSNGNHHLHNHKHGGGSSLSIASHSHHDSHNSNLSNGRSHSSVSMGDKGSRGSSFGSIVGTFKHTDHSWRKAVKKFKIRRFSNSSESDH